MDDEDDTIRLGREAPPDEEFDDDIDYGPDLGPDERDADLLDGSWEERYYAGRTRGRDWQAIGVALALLALLGMLIPAITVVLR